MISFLNTWAQKIIIVIIICTIIEMIIPNGKNKKFIKTIAGIYVVYTIVAPIIAKINTNETLNLERYLNIIEPKTIETSVSLDNNKYIEEIYIEKLSKDIEEKVRVFGYDVKNIDLEIETEDEKKYGSINNIKLEISKEQTKQEGNIKIETVVIGKENIKEENIINEEEKEKIKSYLGNVYLIDTDIININRLNCSLFWQTTICLDRGG